MTLEEFKKEIKDCSIFCLELELELYEEDFKEVKQKKEALLKALKDKKYETKRDVILKKLKSCKKERKRLKVQKEIVLKELEKRSEVKKDEEKNN